MGEKTNLEQMKEKLLRSKKNGVIRAGAETVKQADEYCEAYKEFLNGAKTEREAVVYAIRHAEAAGFVPFNAKAAYKAGDKVYLNNRNKAIILAVFGKKPCAEGVRIAAAHIDSPRLDLKPNPLYEKTGLAFFDTHYYGGIKKYQWTTIPLALHGRVVKKDGTCVDIRLGEDAEDPQFCVTDLLPHLAGEQMQKTMAKAIDGENLDILIGSRPLGDDDGADSVKTNIMMLIYEKYGITEDDFVSADLTMVPAFRAVDIGFDRSMIGSYGHDDRVCAYTSFTAALAVEQPEHTTVTVLTDKEEIGSEGNTGLQCDYLRHFIEDLAAMENVPAREVFRRSTCFSADVNAAYDPAYASAYEENNSAYCNGGVVITKYTGSRGKSGTSDATAEYMGSVRKILDDAGVVWQTGELGRVDIGGGGTVAMYIANLNVDVVDVGVPVLSMHAPLEVVSKLDVFMTFRAFEAFFRS